MELSVTERCLSCMARTRAKEGKEVNDPFTQLVEAAVATHELFESYVEAGFTENQALTLIIGMMSTAAQQKREENG